MQSSGWTEQLYSNCPLGRAPTATADSLCTTCGWVGPGCVSLYSAVPGTWLFGPAGEMPTSVLLRGSLRGSAGSTFACVPGQTGGWDAEETRQWCGVVSTSWRADAINCFNPSATAAANHTCCAWSALPRALQCRECASECLECKNRGDERFASAAAESGAERRQAKRPAHAPRASGSPVEQG